jgi:hypothetical protein
MIVLTWLKFVSAVYLDEKSLTGFDLFHIAFQKDRSVVIPRLRYDGEISDEIKSQFRQYLALMSLDEPTWVLVWCQWKETHNEKDELLWEEEQGKYVDFAKFVSNLENEEPKTAEELSELERMLINISSAEHWIPIDDMGAPVTLEDGNLSPETTAKLLPLFIFLIIVIVAKFTVLGIQLAQEIFNKL